MRNAARGWTAAVVTAGLLFGPAPTTAQIMFPTDSLERWMEEEAFEIGMQTGARFEGDRTQRTALSLENGNSILVKWGKAPRGGEEFNNVPRYEVAAYELQKLFLDEDQYVVPPTVVRTFPLHWYRETVDRTAGYTFDAAQSVLVVLQYWMFGVQSMEEIDWDRFEEDRAYARAAGNVNVLTYLIDHKDANIGNFLISGNQANPRIFSVDNGVSFSSQESDRGDDWSRMQVEELPADLVERLRTITREDLDRTLGVLAQWEVRNGALVRVEPGPNIQDNRGIRIEDDVVQLGLTSREIARVEDRLQRLLEDVDEGDIEIF